MTLSDITRKLKPGITAKWVSAEEGVKVEINNNGEKTIISAYSEPAAIKAVKDFASINRWYN